MKILTIRWAFALFCGLGALPVFAQLTVSKLFSDHAVLQRGKEIPVWGWAPPGAEIRVLFNLKEYTTITDATGKWRVKLPAMEAGGPYEMTIAGGGERVTFKDLLFGDVWLCSGQSNMEWILQSSLGADVEIPQANDPELRHFKVKRGGAQKPEPQLPGGDWAVCSPEKAPYFTAVGYYFAKELRRTQKVPIGLINATWGGSRIEAWMSAEALGIENGEAMVKQIEKERKMVEENRMTLIRKKFGRVPKNDEGLQNGVAVWAATDFDDSDWPYMNLPSLWEDRGLKGIDGIVWFRREFTLNEAQAAQPSRLFLPPIDDSDWTYINGHKVGETIGIWNEPRQYEIPAGVLKAGKNIITVRVEDTGQGGGIYGDPEIMYLAGPDYKVRLDGPWRYQLAEYRSGFRHRMNLIPMMLYNKMIYPMLDFPIKGVIWYQGESNANGEDAIKYADLFPALIEDWRFRFNQDDFPFLYVQLANFMEARPEPSESDWALLREAQTATLLKVPNTAQAVIIDIGEADDIHPRNKSDVGYRLALGARKLAYGEDLEYMGPLFKYQKTEGKKIRIGFSHIGSGLTAHDKYGYVKGFAIAGEDKHFVWAKALIEGDEVVVWSEEVPDPKYVRYAWADNPDDANLYNKEGLPASPFRTDK